MLAGLVNVNLEFRLGEFPLEGLREGRQEVFIYLPVLDVDDDLVVVVLNLVACGLNVVPGGEVFNLLHQLIPFLFDSLLLHVVIKVVVRCELFGVFSFTLGELAAR